MIRPYAASAVRLLAQQSFLPPAPRMGARRLLSRSAPLRNGKATGHERPVTPTGGSSDLPWILGAVAFTIPAGWYLLTAGSPAPQTSDPHAPVNNASTSHAERDVPEHHQEPGLPGQSKDELPQSQEPEEGEKAEEKAETESCALGGAATDTAADKARDATGRAAGQAQGVTKESSKAVSSAIEKISATASGATERAEGTVGTASETVKSTTGSVADEASIATEGGSSNAGGGEEDGPQKHDPGDAAVKDADSVNTTAGK